MKKRLLASVMALAMVVSGTVFYGDAVTVKAEENAVTESDVVVEITDDNIAFANERLVDTNGFNELCVGDTVDCWTDAVDGNGKTLEFEKDWTFLSEDLVSDVMDGAYKFYSAYDDPKKASLDEDRVYFTGAIPEEAFGKYVYEWVFITRVDADGNKILTDLAGKLIRSEYKINTFGDTDWNSFFLHDDNKTVGIFSIFYGNKGGNAQFVKSITVGGKKYKVTDIGQYALELSNNSKGMSSLTLHSGITGIGEYAFRGAKDLKTITIQGNITKIGKGAFKDVNKKAVFKIKASEKNYKKIVKLIKKSGVPKTVTFKRVK